MPERTVFKKILDGDLPADVVYEDEQCLAFHDISPQAPTHVLVIPRKEIPSLQDLSDEDEQLVGHLFLVVKRVAEELGLENGYRTIVNCGVDGGQDVNHLHVHLLGGRKLTWPPG